jgi:hypothetical protein
MVESLVGGAAGDAGLNGVRRGERSVGTAAVVKGVKGQSSGCAAARRECACANEGGGISRNGREGALPALPSVPGSSPDGLRPVGSPR